MTFLDNANNGNGSPAALKQVVPLLKAFVFVQELISQKNQDHPYQSGISIYQRQTRHYDHFFALCAQERAKAAIDIANFQTGRPARKSTGTKPSRQPRRAGKETARQNP